MRFGNPKHRERQFKRRRWWRRFARTRASNIRQRVSRRAAGVSPPMDRNAEESHSLSLLDAWSNYLAVSLVEFMHDWFSPATSLGPRAAWRGRAFVFESLEYRWLLTAVPFSERTVDGDFDGADSVYSADVDGDGDLDVLGAAGHGADAVTWWENSLGDGSVWTEHSVDGGSDGAHSLHSADLDGDMDLLGAANRDDDITWWENREGDGSAWSEHTVDGDYDGASSVHSADVDGDGDMDVLGAAMGADDITWWENTTGDGSIWSEHVVDGNFYWARSVYSADVDGDGDTDVLGASRSGDIAWWENTSGDGTVWIKHTIDGAFDGASSVYSADVDGDGAMDVLGAGDETVTWWENGGGRYALTTTSTAPATIFDGLADDVLKTVAAHGGRTGDTDVELVTFDLLFVEPAGVSLTTTEANNLIENLQIYVDANANGTFEIASDTLVTTVESLSLAAGVQTVAFDDGDPNVQVSFGAPRTYFVVTELTDDASSQSPSRFRIIHRAESSTAEDRDHDIPPLYGMGSRQCIIERDGIVYRGNPSRPDRHHRTDRRPRRCRRVHTGLDARSRTRRV